MRTLLISGVCGFVGASLALLFRKSYPVSSMRIVGFDNLSRAGSWHNRQRLKAADIEFHHADIRNAWDLEHLPAFDWVIDAAANPSVLAGTGKSDSRSLMDTNLVGTLNLLELCKRHRAGMILLSTSRVYSLKPICSLPLEPIDGAFVPTTDAYQTDGLSEQGFDETFSTAPPVSLYGASKLTSESLAIEYSLAYHFPVWINRCGVLAGAGQFGRPDQGIFAFWLHSWREKSPLRYIGFGGSGYQVRDCLHPSDLFQLINQQVETHDQDQDDGRARIINVSGGLSSARSLRQISHWCQDRWGPFEVTESVGENRPFDIPWMVLDSQNTRSQWNWRPEKTIQDILEEIAEFADQHPDWLSVSAG